LLLDEALSSDLAMRLKPEEYIHASDAHMDWVVNDEHKDHDWQDSSGELERVLKTLGSQKGPAPAGLVPPRPRSPRL
jgi:hypothetical protein